MAEQAALTQWDKLAGRIYEAHMADTLLDSGEVGPLPDNVGDGYVVQDKTIAMLSAEPRAWKLGAPAKAAQEGFGIAEPLSGPVPEGLLLPSPAKIDASGYSAHVFEPEIAITVGKDIDHAIGIDEAREAIASIHPAIEVINFRIADGRTRGAMGMIMDLGGNGGLVLGDPAPAGEDDYWALTLDVRINGASVAQRTPPPPETDLAQLLSWMSGHLADRGHVLRKGDVITTGSQGGLIPYKPGALIEVDFAGAGMAVVQF